jgi:hypothetical protein
MAPSRSAPDVSADAALGPYRSLSRRRRVLEPWFRRCLLVLLVALVGAALLDVFGQRPVTSHARSAAAELSVQAPVSLRGGLIYQARFTVTAHRALRKPTLVLGSGWFESMSVNSTVPDAVSSVSRNGSVHLTYPRMQGGDSLTVWIYFQVNPTTTGTRRQSVELDDAGVRLQRIERSARIWP